MGANKKTYVSVAEMVKDISDDRAFAKEVETHLLKRTLVHKLCALRLARGLTQSVIAKQMSCSQSRVSKFENSEDSDVRLGDLVKYASSLGLEAALKIAANKSVIAEGWRKIYLGETT